MKYLLDLRVLDQMAQAGRLADWQRVDDGAAVARAQLEQVDAVDEPMKARPLGVDGEFGHAGKRVGELLDAGYGVQVLQWMIVAGRSHKASGYGVCEGVDASDSGAIGATG